MPSIQRQLGKAVICTWFLLVTAAIVVVPAAAQEKPRTASGLDANGEWSRLERFVLRAMRAADTRLARAARLENKAEAASEKGDDSRHLALLRGVKQHIRIAYLGLERFQGVDLEGQLDRVYRASLEQIRTELAQA